MFENDTKSKGSGFWQRVARYYRENGWYRTMATYRDDLANVPLSDIYAHGIRG